MRVLCATADAAMVQWKRQTILQRRLHSHSPFFGSPPDTNYAQSVMGICPDSRRAFLQNPSPG